MWDNRSVLTIETLVTQRLRLEPLVVDDAETLADLFDNPAVLEFIGEEGLTRDVLLGRFQRMPNGSGTDEESWLAWTVRFDAVTTGLAQATVRGSAAELAWVIGVEWQKRGFATEAADAVRRWLAGRGITAFTALIHPGNLASNVVAERTGLRSSGEADDDGEIIWVSDGVDWSARSEERGAR